MLRNARTVGPRPAATNGGRDAPRAARGAEPAIARVLRAGGAAAVMFATAAAGCATADPVPSTMDGSVTLAAGGHAEGAVTIPPLADGKLRLVNRGPGKVQFSVLADGSPAASGSLTAATVTVGGGMATKVRIVLDAGKDAGAVVEHDLRDAGGVSITWDLSRARGAAAVPGAPGTPVAPK